LNSVKDSLPFHPLPPLFIIIHKPHMIAAPVVVVVVVAAVVAAAVVAAGAVGVVVAVAAGLEVVVGKHG